MEILLQIQLNRLRSKLVDDFELIHWMVFVFIGGAFNYVAIVALAEYYLSLISQLTKTLGRPATISDTLPQLAIPAALVYSMPVILSVILTRYHPKRIVPPFYMQAVSFGLIVVFAYNLFQAYGIILYFIGIEYVLAGGWTQDSVARTLLGRMGGREDILTLSLKVEARLDDLVGILSNEKFSGNLNLGRKIHRYEGRAVFVSPKRFVTFSAIELKRGQEETPTFLNVATFEKEKFCIKRTDESDEWGRAEVAYLKDIFSRQDPAISVSDSVAIGAEGLAEEILGEMRGISSPWQMRSWISLLAFLAPIIIVAAFFFELHDYTNGYVTLALTAPYLAVEAPRVLARKYE